MTPTRITTAAQRHHAPASPPQSTPTCTMQGARTAVPIIGPTGAQAAEFGRRSFDRVARWLQRMRTHRACVARVRGMGAACVALALHLRVYDHARALRGGISGSGTDPRACGLWAQRANHCAARWKKTLNARRPGAFCRRDPSFARPHLLITGLGVNSPRCLHARTPPPLRGGTRCARDVAILRLGVCILVWAHRGARVHTHARTVAGPCRDRVAGVGRFSVLRACALVCSRAAGCDGNGGRGAGVGLATRG